MPAPSPATAPTKEQRLKIPASYPGPWGGAGNFLPAGSAFPTPPVASVDPMTTGSTAPSFVQSLRDALAHAIMSGGSANPAAAGGPGGGLPGETLRDKAALQYNLERGAGHSYAYTPPAAAPMTTASTAATPAKATTPRPQAPKKGAPPQPPYNPLSSAYVPVGPPQPPPYDPLSSANTGLPAGEPVGGPRSWRPSWLTWG